MIQPEVFLSALERQEIDLFAGVPDSLLKTFLLVLSEKIAKDHHFICANEGNAVALAAGYHLATGGLPLVYMQNSGLGNAVNPLASLCHRDVYSIPMILLVGWRGEPGVKDEPQHMAMGQVTPDFLERLRIEFEVLDARSDPETVVASVADRARKLQAPVAILCRKGAFAEAAHGSVSGTAAANAKTPGVSSRVNSALNLGASTGVLATAVAYARGFEDLPLSRQEAIEIILDACDPDDILVCTTGYTGREMFGQREARNQVHTNDFLNAGAMGHASSVALGIALGVSGFHSPSTKRVRRILCLDGDGAVIMHMGGLAVIGTTSPHNLTHILLNNGVHDSVGAQPTAGFQIDLASVASSCGYPRAARCSTGEELKKLLPEHLSAGELTFLEVRIRAGGREDLPRPPQDFRRSKQEFMAALQA